MRRKSFAQPAVIRCHRALTLALFASLGGLSLAAAAELPRHIEPHDESGSAAAVVVGDWPLAHTAQFLPVDEGGELAAREPAAQMEAALQAVKVS